MGALIRVQKRTPGQRLVLVLRKYLAVMRVSIASNLAYMMEVFFRGLFLVVLIFVLGQVWKTTYSARGATLLSGFSISDMISNRAAAEMSATSMPACTRRIDQEVRAGQRAYLLVRPCSY